MDDQPADSYESNGFYNYYAKTRMNTNFVEM